MAPSPKARSYRLARHAAPMIPIRSVGVEQLFGKYTIPNIPLYGRDPENRRIAFLYGDNGSGKTTILKLLYAALSDERNAGLRGFLARTRFARMRIEFEDGQIVSIQKTDGALQGSYFYRFIGPRIRDDIHIGLDETGKVSLANNDESIVRLSAYLATLCPTIVFVNDQRTIRSNYEPWDVRGFLNSRLEHSKKNWSEQYRFGMPTDIDQVIGSGLDHLLDETHRLFVSKAITGNVEASHGVGQIYLNIARTLSRPSGDAHSTASTDFGLFRDRIEALEERLSHYEKYRIIEGQPIREIGAIVRRTPTRSLASLIEVIEPYIASIEKRVESNRQLLDMAYQFESNVNEFLSRKKMVYTLDGGIRFSDSLEEYVEPQHLSSGERHLLYLFSASLLSRERNSLIIVDEPELSLNYKWQRLLVGALLDIAGEGAQFLMATHSFEIISKYKAAVFGLEPN